MKNARMSKRQVHEDEIIARAAAKAVEIARARARAIGGGLYFLRDGKLVQEQADGRLVEVPDPLAAAGRRRA